MKNYTSIITIIILTFLVSSSLFAQDAPNFTGTIIYKMEALGDLSEGERAQAEGTITAIYGDGVYKTTTVNVMMSFTQIIYADSIISIYDMMGEQYAFRMTTEESELMNQNKKDTIIEEMEVNFINETKEVLGYTCHKAEINSNDDITEVFYSKKYTLNDFMKEDNMKKIEGLPLEYTIPLNDDVSIHMIATSIKKKKKIKAKVFDIPFGVKVMSFEEMQSMMGQ